MGCLLHLKMCANTILYPNSWYSAMSWGQGAGNSPAFWNKRPDNLMTLLVFGSAISDGQHLQSVKSIRYLIWGWLDRALIVYWKSTKTANPLLASIPQMALKNRSVSFGVLYCQSMEFLLKPVWVSHLTAKCELELVYKFLTVLQMRPQRKNVIFSWSFTVTSLLAFFSLSFSS